jgi:hypothetical protein
MNTIKYGVESTIDFSRFILKSVAFNPATKESFGDIVEAADMVSAAFGIVKILGYSHVTIVALNALLESGGVFFKVLSFPSSVGRPLGELFQVCSSTVSSMMVHSKNQPTIQEGISDIQNGAAKVARGVFDNLFTRLLKANPQSSNKGPNVFDQVYHVSEYARLFFRDALAVLSVFKLSAVPLMGLSLAQLSGGKVLAEFVSSASVWGASDSNKTVDPASSGKSEAATPSRPGVAPVLSQEVDRGKARLEAIVKNWNFVSKVSYLALGVIGVMSLVPSAIALLPAAPAAALIALGQLSMAYIPAVIPLIIKAEITASAIYLSACISGLFGKYVKSCYPEPVQRLQTA